MRTEIDARCRDALSGAPAYFACGSGADRITFSVTPVRDAAGGITHGLLLSGDLAAAVTAVRV
jgi:hypothetical protein